MYYWLCIIFLIYVCLFGAVSTWGRESSSTVSRSGGKDGSGAQPVHLTLCVDQRSKYFLMVVYQYYCVCFCADGVNLRITKFDTIGAARQRSRQDHFALTIVNGMSNIGMESLS